MKLIDFVPPVATLALKRLRSNPGRKQYADYTKAVDDCTEHGYENTDIVNVVVEKTKRYRDSLSLNKAPVQLNATSAYSLCSLLVASGQNEINVLDFGGAAGAHYFSARAILASTCRLNWIVVETPAMVEQARSTLSNDELSFSSDLLEAASSLKRVDLLHTSGTLQCVDTPYDYLSKLMSTSAHYILFNRLGLTKGKHESSQFMNHG
jgi:putative methyltransferase (TIGR04325 family)